ncbi:SH2 domain-containing protein A-like [Rutidosis leptorrhynchoides]|uniref:SH2 domain-containing protein A-like n=1 Tax=Rutidosis leptorrhynchoides TaxID=125765 RepID=UPI003A9A0BA6
MSTIVDKDGGYSSLNNLKLEIAKNNESKCETFSLCFWLYLPADSSPFPSTLIRQHHSDLTSNAPFLALTESKEMVLYCIRNDVTPGTQTPSARSKNEIPVNKWVHIGCEVSTDTTRLYFNSEIVGEVRVTCPFDSLKKISLIGANENETVDVYGVEILPNLSSIKDYFVKDPPVQLYFDSTSATDIEEECDGVWSVVGGKISCRKSFSVDVVLKDAFRHLVNKEMEVFATLTYADNGEHVENTDDSETPLLTTSDGIEFASCDRPSKLINGRASFRLKISQLSSKCDNRLFRVKFNIPKMGNKHPFLEVFSPAIRCISRSRNTRPSTLIWKRSTSAIHVVSGTPWLDGCSVEPINNVVQEPKPAPSSKRVKLGQGPTLVNLQSDNNSLKQQDHQDHRLTLTSDIREETHERKDNTPCDSESSEATNTSNGSPISDLNVFKYCLGSLTEKSNLLKELSTSASEKDIMDFAVHVSQYSGCFHHRNQIRISKRMLEDGTKVWNLLSQSNHEVMLDRMFYVLGDQFIKISGCRNRFLAPHDFEVLRRISGCQEPVTRENFEKLWCWLYPVAFGLSQNGLNNLWDSRWIEGLVTKEEAEISLHGPGNSLVDPGTFILRFPTSRSWPHPDAGNLVVTYVGSDYVIHHRTLCLDFFHSCGGNTRNGKSLKEMLLEERELSRLGRITTRNFRRV